MDLLFRREFSYYLITIYIPCCMLVIVSWVSFWLDANAVPARVSLGVTTLLTMATQTTGINNSLPPVSYTKVSIISFHLWGLFHRQQHFTNTHTYTKVAERGPGILSRQRRQNNLDIVISFNGVETVFDAIDTLFTGATFFRSTREKQTIRDIHAFFSR